MQDSRDDFLERIYILYAHKLENMCLSYVNYQEVYRDIVDESIQKTFETATRQYKELQDNPYLEGWLCQTCMNRLTTTLRTYRRRMKKQMSLDDDITFTLPPEQIRDAMDEIVNRISNKELLDRILQALNERERDTFLTVVCRLMKMGNGYTKKSFLLLKPLAATLLHT